MKAATIYRCEDAEGHGLYSGYAQVSLSGGNGTEHPCPDMDGGLCEAYERDFRPHHRFGFGSLQQLRQWLFNSEWFEPLHAANFSIHVYEAEEAAVGWTQAFFDKKTARCVEVISFLDLKTMEIPR